MYRTCFSFLPFSSASRSSLRRRRPRALRTTAERFNLLPIVKINGTRVFSLHFDLRRGLASFYFRPPRRGKPISRNAPVRCTVFSLSSLFLSRTSASGEGVDRCIDLCETRHIGHRVCEFRLLNLLTSTAPITTQLWKLLLF